MAGVVFLLMQFLLPIARSELTEFTEPMARKLIEFAARFLPENRREKRLRAWLADLPEQPGKWYRVIWALDHVRGAIKIRWTDTAVLLSDLWVGVCYFILLEAGLSGAIGMVAQFTHRLPEFLPILTIHFAFMCVVLPIFAVRAFFLFRQYTPIPYFLLPLDISLAAMTMPIALHGAQLKDFDLTNMSLVAIVVAGDFVMMGSAGGA